MTLLTIANAVARNVGVARTDQVSGSVDRTWTVMLELANATGEELARRVDWGQLTRMEDIEADDRASGTYPAPSALSRLVSGIAAYNLVDGAKTTTIRPLTRAEWGALVPTAGTPRYFILENQDIEFWPFPANGDFIRIVYQSKNWCSNATDAWAADDDTSLIDESLFAKGLEVRWRRQEGMPYEDQEAEYEAALEEFARFNDRSRL